MKQNPTAKYIKFWFCVTFSAWFFNRRHFRSGNDNLTYLSKLSLLNAFRANSSIGMFIVYDNLTYLSKLSLLNAFQANSSIGMFIVYDFS